MIYVEKKIIKSIMISYLIKNNINAISKRIGINREKLRLSMIFHFPYIIKNKKNSKMLKMLLTTNDVGEIRIERFRKIYKIDAKYKNLFISLNLRDNGNGYLAYSEKRSTKYFHRLIMNAKKGEEIDHKNRFKNNNCISNLRKCSKKQNIANIKKTGWCYDARNFKKRYIVTINGVFISRFEFCDEAEKCYRNIRKVLDKEFFPYE